MKPPIDFITVFEKTMDDNGQEYYTGTLDPTVMKKSKKETRLILMKGSLLPVPLIGNDPNAKESIYLFSQAESSDG